jgi:hypothetical protein
VKKEEIDFIIDNPHKVRFYKPRTALDRLEQLYDLIRMVLADSIIDPRELTVCSSIALKLGFKSENIHDIIDFLIEEQQKGTPRKELISKVRRQYERFRFRHVCLK